MSKQREEGYRVKKTRHTHEHSEVVDRQTAIEKKKKILKTMKRREPIYVVVVFGVC